MPTKPSVRTLNSDSPAILNAIRDEASATYREAVPTAYPNVESVRAIGKVFDEYVSLRNEFLSALFNRIARVIVTSKLYSNPWNVFKKGIVEFGDTIEEIFVNIAKPFTYNPEVAETEWMKREIPDVRAKFHSMNYQKFYKDTIQEGSLRQAFLSWRGVDDLIGRIVDSMYTGANYDEFITMKYMLARALINGNIGVSTVATPDAAGAAEVVTTVKGISNLMEFMNTSYNEAGVYNYSNKNDQFIIINAKFDAVMDVNVLATAFNMDRAEFMGHRVLVDSFGSLDNARLDELFKDSPTYVSITPEQQQALDNIPAIIVDREWFMQFDNLLEFREAYNGEGLYWQYWLHVWKTFSHSPFANAIAFIAGTPTVNSVTVSPGAVTVSKGTRTQFTAQVEVSDFAPQGVKWAVDSTISTIDSTGLLNIPASETASSLTITATSNYDSTKSGTATVTIN